MGTQTTLKEGSVGGSPGDSAALPPAKHQRGGVQTGKKIRKIDIVLVDIQIPTGYCYQADIYLWPWLFLLLNGESGLH